jgi:hypothetical protein
VKFLRVCASHRILTASVVNVFVPRSCCFERSLDYSLDGEAVIVTFIPKGFETLAGGKRSATTGSLVRIDVSRRDTRIRHSCIPPACVGVAGRFPVVALRLPPANI